MTRRLAGIVTAHPMATLVVIALVIAAALIVNWINPWDPYWSIPR